MILYETKYLTLKAAKREDKEDWVYAMRPNASDVAVILPVIKGEIEDEILFLITRRPPLIEENVADFCVEVPAGLVGDENKDETVDEALRKELLEETGLMAESFKICSRKVSSTGGLTSETSTIAIAFIKDKTLKLKPVSDGGVIADRVYIKKSNIKNFLNEKEKEGCAISAQTLSALYYLD